MMKLETLTRPYKMRLQSRQRQACQPMTLFTLTQRIPIVHHRVSQCCYILGAVGTNKDIITDPQHIDTLKIKMLDPDATPVYIPADQSSPRIDTDDPKKSPGRSPISRLSTQFLTSCLTECPIGPSEQPKRAHNQLLDTHMLTSHRFIL